MDIKYIQLFFACNCGIRSDRADEVGVTERGEMIFIWKCACGNLCVTVKKLETLASLEFLEADKSSATPIPAPQPGFTDEEFLKSMGIKSPE